MSGEVDTLYDLNDLRPIRLGLESGEDSGEESVYEMDRFIVEIIKN